MFLRSSLRSFVILSLGFSWLMASLAPSLLIHLTVGSRILAAAAQSQSELSAISLAMIRGELCGLAVEVDRAEDNLPEDSPIQVVDGAKIVLGLAEGGSDLIVPFRPGFPTDSDRTAPETLRADPPGPPPRVV